MAPGSNCPIGQRPQFCSAGTCDDCVEQETIIISGGYTLTGFDGPVTYYGSLEQLAAQQAEEAKPPKQPKFKGWQPKDARRFPVAPRVLR